MTAPLIAVNKAGRRIGDSHQRAKLTDSDVDHMLRLREEGWGYRRLARKFEIGKTQVRRICSGLRRSQTADRYKVVRCP